MVRLVNRSDFGQICEIYNYYIAHTTVTFETESVSTNEMYVRLIDSDLRLPCLVFEEGNEILGYAYATQWKARNGYLHTAEISIYLRHTKRKKGIGTALYAELLQQLIDLNYHAIIAGIALPNEGSIRLHQKFGFKQVAHFREVGFKFEQWIDVAYWQLLIKKPGEA